MSNAVTLQDLRARFPALDQHVNGQPLAYLDNAATTQKPDTVIQALIDYYRHDNANVHRAVHTLAGRATRGYEGARDRIAEFINAPGRENVIFTRGTTEAINLVAYSWARHNLGAGDEILITEMEHHSNIVPWQLICAETGAMLKAAPVTDSGELDMAAFKTLLGSRTKLVSVSDASNAIGTVNPVDEIVTLAHDAGARVLVDAAQAVAHHKLDVQTLDADFVAFSAHKMFGPTGFGVLYGKTEVLEQAQPWQGGGDMIETVTLEKSTWNTLPYRFEAGTPNIADTIATGAAVDFMRALDLDMVIAHEQALLAQATQGLSGIDGLRIIGTAPHKAAIVSFVMDTAHPQDIGTLLDENGIAVRTGHHCAMPLMARFGVPGTVRASFALYNTAEEVNRLIDSMQRIARLFA